MEENIKKQNEEINNLNDNTESFDDVKELVDNNKMDEAIELLNDKLALTGNMQCHFELAKVYMKKHDYEEAISHLLLLLDNSVIKPYPVCYKLCICYFNVKNYSSSFDYGVKAYKYDEREVLTENYLYYLVISSANNSRRFNEAIDFIEKYPFYQSHGVVSQIIKIYHELKMDEKALEILTSTGFKSGTTYEKNIEASVYYSVGQVQKALEVLNGIRQPDNFTLFLKGKIQYRQSNFLGCEETFKALIQDKFRLNKSAYWLIKSQIRLGKLEEAKDNLKYMNVKFDNTKFLKANLYIYSNELDEAEVLLEKISETSKKYRCISLIYLASIAIRRGNYGDALNLLCFIYFNYITELDKYTLANISMLITFVKARLGLDTEANGYMPCQIVDYSAQATIDRMQEYALNYSFYPNADLESIFYKLQELIANEYPKICACTNVCDTYIVDFPSAGISYGNILDKMQVITIIGTKDIISFYPVNGLSYWKNFDGEQIKNDINVKKLNLIEKNQL